MLIELLALHLPNYHNESFAQSKQPKNKVQYSAEKYPLWSPLSPNQKVLIEVLKEFIAVSTQPETKLGKYI